MNTKFIKSAIEKRIAKKDDQHISPIAGALFGVFLIIAIFGAIFGDSRYPDVVIGAWVLGCTLIGTYFLFAMKVASQW